MRIFRVLFVVLACWHLAVATVAASTENGMFQAALTLALSAEKQSEEQKRMTLTGVRKILDQIVLDAPDSDLAAKIRGKEVIEGLNVAALDAFLAGEQADARTDPDAVNVFDRDAKITVPVVRSIPDPKQEKGPIPADIDAQIAQAGEIPFPKSSQKSSTTKTKIIEGTQLTERALQLSKSDRRELQIRLKLAGFDPGNPDGSLGPRTRTAIEAWQIQNQFSATGYLSAPQLDLLRTQTNTDFANYSEPQTNNSRKTRKKRKVKICSATLIGVRLCRIEYR
ncbi:MAG: peptidoglycan-binding domain-containing protein [Pseudomonadota bacterium]